MQEESGTGMPQVLPPTTPPGGITFNLPDLPETVTAEVLDRLPREDDLPAATDKPVVGPERPPLRPRALRRGCYLLRYTPIGRATAAFPLHYDGTLRVERVGTDTTASGDLYVHRPPVVQLPFSRAFREPDPAAGIPIFSRRNYRFYVRVTRILEFVTFSDRFTLGFELHRFHAATNSWSLAGTFTALMEWTTAPAGYPSSTNYLRGAVRGASGAVVGELTMGWIDRHLRRAVVEIDRVPASEAPLANAAGQDWVEIFEQVGWDVTVEESESNLPEPSGQSWSDAEMHAALLDHRASASLDRQWRYWLLCVRRLDSTERGIMFDASATDSNAVPREGAGLSSHWMIPNSSTWGHVRGMRFGAATDPYFRTAVHEIGHALGLFHNTVDNGFMHTTPDIAASAQPPEQFPDNVQWSFAPDDAKRLRHLPDIWVRPGGIPFGAASFGSAPISADDAVTEVDGLGVEVSPLLSSVPIGAPVRVEVRLGNDTGAPFPVPADMSLKGGHVSGRVIDPSGTVRTFKPLLRCIDDHPMTELADGDLLEDSLTLLRGPEGALFPATGAHRIEVDVDWEVGDTPIRVTGGASIMVTAAVDDHHAEAALHVLATPDAVLTLALGGDHLDDGIGAVHHALADDTLRPHFAWIESKRLARPFLDRPADLGAAAELLDASTVMSPAEVRKAARMVDKAEDAPEAMADVIKAKLADL